MLTIAIANQKVGVGKTTSAINIATAMAATGWKTMLIDLDPQGNASTGLGVAAGERELSSYDVLVDEVSLADASVPSTIPGLDIVPATVDLSGGITRCPVPGVVNSTHHSADTYQCPKPPTYTDKIQRAEHPEERLRVECLFYIMRSSLKHMNNFATRTRTHISSPVNPRPVGGHDGPPVFFS